MSSARLKVVLVGAGAVGKTSLVNKYTRNIFSNTYINTIGCDIYVKKVILHNASCKLVIHDIGGQFEFRDVRQTYLTNADIVMVVFALDMQDTQDLDNYIADVLAVSPPPTWAIVGNKIDVVDESKLDLSAVTALAGKHGVPLYLTSAKDGTNVQDMFLDLVKKHAGCELAHNAEDKRVKT